MKRAMCVYLPQWPWQNLRHLRPELRDKAVALVEQQAGGARVAVCSEEALRAGVRPGLPVTEALATHSQLSLEEIEHARDRQGLERLAEWAERYSPIVSLEEGTESLLLDISGCASCFHGEDRLARQAARELRGRGWNARVAVASTLGAAWGVAHSMDAALPFCLVPPEETEKALGPLPLAALRLPDEALVTFASLGIERIEQLASLPRADVPGRFGSLVLQRLDEALGRLPEVIVPRRPPREIQAGCSFAYPTDRLDVLHHAVAKLMERIEAILRSRNRGARKLECWLHHETVAPVRIEVELFRPSGSAPHLSKLLRSHLERIRVAEPVCRVRLCVPSVEMIAQRQLELFDADVSRLEEVGDLIDRLAGQFGRETVTFARLVADCQPEYACRFEPAIPSGKHRQTAPPASAEGDQGIADGHRPLLVWPVPEPIQVLEAASAGAPSRFVWLARAYTVRRSWGPERIATGWWRGDDVRRDYYTVETDRGTRLWLFRRHEDNHWFLHGCFD